MTPQLKAKWLKALRSGEYKQGREKLHNLKEDTYCCLGVLCKAAKIPEKEDFFEDCFVFLHHQDIYVSAKLDTFLLNEFGITGDQHQYLIDMNDGNDSYEFNPQSFSQIADWIEENIKAEAV